MSVRYRRSRPAQPAVAVAVAGPVACAAVAALAEVPVGPRLAAALARIRFGGLSGFDKVLLLRARHRQDNHERGLLLQAVAAVALHTDPTDDDPTDDDPTDPDPTDPDPADPDPDDPGPDEGGDDGDGGVGVLVPDVDEVRAALVLTRRAAQGLCGLAVDLVARMPAVLAAMIAGGLDQPRARIFSSWTEQLCARHTAAVVAH
ncbi:MAG TPA: hypothetical protein VH561_02470, partial [Micromonosporaceae bacterium]